MAAIRQKVKDLLEAKGIKMTNASIAIGQNHAYLQQYIRYGRPPKLSESARIGLAKLLGVSEEELLDERQIAEKALIAVSSPSLASKAPVSLPIINATACCGNGIENETENVIGFWQIPRDEYRAITTAAPERVKMLKVQGDSMEDTLSDGDWVLVDASHNFLGSDGLYLIKKGTALSVKRLQTTVSGDILIKSDNSKYDTEKEPHQNVVIVGKVVYTLKAEKVG